MQQQQPQPPSHGVPPSAEADCEGEVIAVASIADDASEGPTAVWQLYRLAGGVGAGGRITRAYRLHLLDAANAPNEVRRFAAADDATSALLLTSSIVAYLGVRAVGVTLSPAEVATLDRSMQMGKLASALATLQGSPLQRHVSDREAAEADAAWQRTRRSGTDSARLTDAAIPNELKEATVMHQEQPVTLERRRRSWWSMFASYTVMERGLPSLVGSLASVTLVFLLVACLHQRTTDINQIQNRIPPNPLNKCQFESVLYETPTARAKWSFNPVLACALRDPKRDGNDPSYRVSDTAVTVARPIIGRLSVFESVVGVAAGFLSNDTAAPYRVQLGLDRSTPPLAWGLGFLWILFVVGSAIVMGLTVALTTQEHRHTGLSAHLRVLGLPDHVEMAARLLSVWLSGAVVVSTLSLFYWCYFAFPFAALLIAHLTLLAASAQAELLAIVARPCFAFLLGLVTLIGPLVAVLACRSAVVEVLMLAVSPPVAALFGLSQVLFPGYVQLSVPVGWAGAALLLQTVAYLTLTWYAGRKWPNDDSSVASDLPNPARLLGRLCGRLTQAADAGVTDEADVGTSDHVALRLVNVAKAFNGEPVLNLSMVLRRGDSVALLGHNGSGKSTLLSILVGRIPADSYAAASVFGLDLNRHLDTIRAHTGYCPQKTVFARSLTPRQALTQVALLRGAPVDAAEIDTLLRYFDIEGDVAVVSRTAGEQRRVAVACAFVGKPALVLLDEPTTGIDDASCKKIWELIALQQRRGVTILMSTHSMEEAETACNLVAVMANGTIAAQGTAGQLKVSYCTGHRLALLHARAQRRVEDVASGVAAEGESRFDTAMVSALVSKLYPGAVLAAEFPGVAHEYYLPAAAGGDIETLLRGLEQNQLAQLGVASFELREPSLEDVCLRVIEAAIGADVAVVGAAAAERTLQDLESMQPALENARTDGERSMFGSVWWQRFRIVARLRIAWVRAHRLDELVLGVVVPIAVILLGFGLTHVLSRAAFSPLIVSPPSQSAPLCEAALKLLATEVSDITFVPDLGFVPLTRLRFRAEPAVLATFSGDHTMCEVTIVPSDTTSASAASNAMSVVRAVTTASGFGALMPQINFDSVLAEPATDFRRIRHAQDTRLESVLLGLVGVIVAVTTHVLHTARSTAQLNGMAPLLNVHGLGPFGVESSTFTIDAIVRNLVVVPPTIVSMPTQDELFIPPQLFVVLLIIICVASALQSKYRDGIGLAVFIAVISSSAVVLATIAFALLYIAVVELFRYGCNALDSRLACFSPYAGHARLGLHWGRAHPALHHVNHVVVSDDVPTLLHSDTDVEREALRLMRESASPAGRPADAVAFHCVSFKYPGGPNAPFVLKNVSWGVRAGAILGIVGPNGAGKTTTLNLVLKNLTPLSPGGITFGGLPSDYSGSDVWRLIGFGWCPQLDAYDGHNDFTAVDYIRLHLELRLGRTPFGATQRCDLGQSGGLDAALWWRYALNSLAVFNIPADVAVRQLSGGMQRRLSTALALFCGASVVVLDEPTNGVDPMARQRMWRVMRWWAKARQCAMIVTSHSMHEVECLCDCVAVLTGGELRCFGAPSHLRATFGKGHVAEVTVGPQTNVALLDAEIVAHFGRGAATVTTRNGGALRCYALGEVHSVAASYSELVAIAQQCGALSVHVGRASLGHAYLRMTR